MIDKAAVCVCIGHGDVIALMNDKFIGKTYSIGNHMLAYGNHMHQLGLSSCSFHLVPMVETIQLLANRRRLDIDQE